jgi:hypothetical protein
VGKIGEKVRRKITHTISAELFLMIVVQFDLGRCWCWRKNTNDTK